MCSPYFRYFKTFKRALRDHKNLPELVQNMSVWFTTWSAAVSHGGTAFSDPIANVDAVRRQQTLKKLENDIDQLVEIVRRELGIVNKQRKKLQPTGISRQHQQQAQLSRLQQVYVPPGTLRPDGPRHDNDSASTADIRIAPTHQELTSPHHPALPFFVPGAPHHLPRGSMEKHLDIQFRLLREELMFVFML